MDELIAKILEYVEPDETPTAESDLYADCGLSSFDMVCLKEELCAMYGCDESNEAFRRCRTVGDLAKVLGI